MLLDINSHNVEIFNSKQFPQGLMSPKFWIAIKHLEFHSGNWQAFHSPEFHDTPHWDHSRKN